MVARQPEVQPPAEYTKGGLLEWKLTESVIAHRRNHLILEEGL